MTIEEYKKIKKSKMTVEDYRAFKSDFLNNKTNNTKTRTDNIWVESAKHNFLK